jgi:nucleoside-diphosphate-sugar epimerase
MKVFVTGSEGFVGKRLVQRLKERGVETVTVDLVAPSGSETIKADICQPDIRNLIPEGADAIIHLAGFARNPDCQNKAYTCFKTNVMATLNLIEAAEAQKVKQFIFASSEWVYGEWQDGAVKDASVPINAAILTSEYAFSKYVSEVNLRQKYQHGFCPVTILRFGIIYGPREKNWSAVESLFHAVRTQNEVSVGSLRTARCFIHIDDIVGGIIASLGLKDFHVLDLQGSNPVSLEDIIETSKKITGCSPEVVETDAANFNIRQVSNKSTLSVIPWKPELDLENGLRTLI